VTSFLFALALVLLLSLAAALPRALLGPSTGDRLLTALLLGTTGVAVLLVLAEAADRPALRNVALVLVAVAATVTGVYSRRRAP
jgi:multicomponent Na+:H+ antiporter subunit F